MADLVYNNWYQSSPVLGGHSPAGFRAPASHAITGDKARLAFFEERMMKIIDEFAEKMIESQERLLAKFQQRLSETFQIPSKTTGKEQTRSSEKEEFSIDVCGGQVLEKEGVPVVDLGPRKMEVDPVGERERSSGKQKTKKGDVPNLKNLAGRRLGGRGDFPGGFVGGGGAGGFAGEMVVIPPLQKYWTKIAQGRRFCWRGCRQQWRSRGLRRKNGADGLSTERSTRQLMWVNSPWEPGGRKRKVEEFPLSKSRRREKVKVFKKGRGRSRYGGGGDFSGGFTGGGSPELCVLDTHGKENWEKARKKIPIGEGDVAGGSDGGGSNGGGSRDVAGNYGVGDWNGGKNSTVKDKGENRKKGYWKKDLEFSIEMRNLLKEVNNGKLVISSKNKAKLVGKEGDISSEGIRLGGHSNYKTLLSANWLYPCLVKWEIEVRPTFILSQFCKPSFLFSLPCKIGPIDEKFIPQPLYSHHHSYISYFTCPFRPICHLIHCSYVCTTIKYSLAINLNSFHSLTHDQPSSTLDNSCPNITQPTHTYISHLLLTLGSTFTHPYIVFFLTHLEDKVEVWAAGSGNYGGVDRVVNGVAGVRDPTGTPSDCEGGWKGIGYDCGGYGGCRLEFGGFARIIFDPGAHRSFLFLTTVMENLWAAASSSFLFLTTVMENLWAAGNEILWWDDSRSNLLNLEMEGSFIHEHFRLKFDHGSIGFSRKKLQHKEIHGKVSSSIEIQVKLQPREGEDSNKYLESSPSVKRRPTFCSYSLADNLIFMVFIPSFIKIVRDYYPP